MLQGKLTYDISLFSIVSFISRINGTTKQRQHYVNQTRKTENDLDEVSGHVVLLGLLGTILRQRTLRLVQIQRSRSTGGGKHFKHFYFSIISLKTSLGVCV